LKIVVADASALVDYLLGASAATAAVVTAPDTDLHVPALCDVEVVAALRRAVRSRLLDLARAEQALDDYLDLPLTRHAHEALLKRVLALRHNFGAYDATYASLAEHLGAGLLTTDAPFAKAVRAHLAVVVV
jgi:predicted nucleic acid-binding protein